MTERIVRDEVTERGGEPYREVEVKDGEYVSEMGWRIDNDPDLIRVCRTVVERGCAEHGGVVVDAFTASAVVQVYDGLKPEYRTRLLEMADGDMARLGTLVWRIVGNARKVK